MKILAILLNFYMALLMLLPCQDSVDTALEIGTTISAPKESNAADDCGQELCPPFCSCACCSIGKNLPLAQHSIVTGTNPSAFYTDALTSAILEQPVTIWQPPKLV